MSPSRSARVSTYVPAFDGIRGLAILFVLLQHWSIYSGPFINGRLGVMLFFILSGYLITGILLRARDQAEHTSGGRRQTLRLFYLRRALRIFPPFYITLVAMAVIGIEDVRSYFFWHATYLSNVLFTLKNSWMDTTSHFWSLSVEEQFYMVWPLLILWVPRKQVRLVIAACFVIPPLARLAIMYNGISEVGLWVLPFCVLDALGLGALMAYIKHERPAFWPQARRIVSIGAVASFLIFWTLYVWMQSTHWHNKVWNVSQDSLLAWILAGCFLMAIDGRWKFIQSLLTLRPLVFLGKISYGVYLIHLFIPELVWMLMARFKIPAGAISQAELVCLWFVLTLSLASLSWLLVERRIMAWKNRLAPAPTVAFPYGSGNYLPTQPDQ